MVFQSYALFPHLNVIDNVAYGLKLRGVSVAARAKKARDLLALVGLADNATRAVTQLSGGQQQRVALARALAIDPAALLLDEPLAALDPEIRERLRDEIRVLQRRFGATTLLVTHDQQEALVMSDRVAVLKDGRLVQIATPRELYERPANSAVAAFVGQSTLFDARVVDRDTVDVGFAQLKADAGARAPGAKVKVLIRPERVDANPSSNAINQLRGKTGLERFIGATVRFDFLIDGASQPLLVESAQVARQAVAIAPVNVILLDD